MLFFFFKKCTFPSPYDLSKAGPAASYHLCMFSPLLVPLPETPEYFRIGYRLGNVKKRQDMVCVMRMGQLNNYCLTSWQESNPLETW